MHEHMEHVIFFRYDDYALVSYTITRYITIITPCYIFKNVMWYILVT